MLSVSQEIKILGGECLAALLSHTNLPSRKRTLSADGSVLLQYATEAKQFPSFPTGHQLPLQAVPQRVLSLVLPRKEGFVLRFLGSTTCPVSPPSSGSARAALIPAGTPRPLSRAPRGVGTPAPAGQRPRTSCAGTRGRVPFLGTSREGEPQPRCSRGCARPGPGPGSPRQGTADRDTHALHLSTTTDRERTPTPGLGDPAARAQPSDRHSPHRCG